MSDSTSTTRRQFVAGAALTGTATLASTGLAATGPAAAVPAPDAFPALHGTERVSVVLHDPRIQIEPAVRARLEARGARFIELTDDPVRQWRGDLADLLSDPSTRLYGVSNWPDFLMVRGLAAESRRHVRHESLDPDTGVFTWLIA